MLHRFLIAAGSLAVLPLAALAADPSPPPADAIRTPPILATPRINGPRVVGARPGHPFRYHLPVSGERPLSLAERAQPSALPPGLTFDPATGNITGSAEGSGVKGRYRVTFLASNAAGKAEADVDFVIGDDIALTPPMGFNTWNHFQRNISDASIRAAADAMVSSGLREHGWTYVNIDDCWQGERDADGNIHGNDKFPDMKALGDYIHSQGLKFGIYSSPGQKTCAGFAGSLGHEDQDARTYAAWGVDYVKYDLCSYRNVIGEQTRQFVMAQLPDDADTYAAVAKEGDELRRVPAARRTPEQAARLKWVDDQLKIFEAGVDPAKRRQFDLGEQQAPYQVFGQALAKVPRDIVYSFCQYGVANVWEWGATLGGNSWRTTGDIQANWKSMSGIGFRQNGLEKYAGPGHWNDPDMLEIGNRGLTPDECYTHLTLWSMLAAPLLIGCDMTTLDPFTASLFTNDEVLAVDQDELGQQGHRLRADGTREVWVKSLANGAMAVALFNRGEESAPVSVTWQELGFGGRPVPTVRDLWRQKDLPADGEGVTLPVAAHGAELLRLERAAAAR